MVVRMRKNRSQTAMRRSHHAISSVRLSRCECGEMRVSHRACPSCGKYNGRVVIDVVALAKRSTRRSLKHQKGLKESGQITESKETTLEATSSKT